MKPGDIYFRNSPQRLRETKSGGTEARRYVEHPDEIGEDICRVIPLW